MPRAANKRMKNNRTHMGFVGGLTVNVPVTTSADLFSSYSPSQAGRRRARGPLSLFRQGIVDAEGAREQTTLRARPQPADWSGRLPRHPARHPPGRPLTPEELTMFVRRLAIAGAFFALGISFTRADDVKDYPAAKPINRDNERHKKFLEVVAKGEGDVIFLG